MSLTASTAARVAFAAGIVVVAATALGAQDTSSSSSSTAGSAPAMLGHAPSAPAIRVSLGDEALAPGERGRVSVRTRADGYVVVVQADPAGRVRVLFPLDPGDSGQRVRADSDLVVRSRGGGRDAFTAGSAVGDGIVLAAVSASRPFRGTLYSHNGHWDPLALPHVAPNTDAEGVLLALVGNLLPKGAHFDYDVAGYRVSESTVASTVANGGEVVADEIPVGANGYDGAAATTTGGGYGANVTSGYGYEDWSYGYGSYYGGIFPIVIVPATYYGGGYGSGYGRGGGGFRNCIDPFYIALGCPPVYHAPYPTPHSGYRPGDGVERRGHSYGIVYTTKPRPAAPPSAPAGYRPRPSGGTPANGGGIAPATVYRTPPARSVEPSAPAVAPTSAPVVRSPWGARRIEQRPAASPPPPPPATSAPARTTTAFPMRAPVIWRAPATAAPSPPPPPASTRSAPAPERHSSPGGSRTRPR